MANIIVSGTFLLSGAIMYAFVALVAQQAHMYLKQCKRYNAETKAMLRQISEMNGICINPNAGVNTDGSESSEENNGRHRGNYQGFSGRID